MSDSAVQWGETFMRVARNRDLVRTHRVFVCHIERMSI